MEYWERYFENESKKPVNGIKGWNRTLPRQRLLQGIGFDPSSHRVLEVGCGSSKTLFDTYGQITNYIGLDLSFHACRLARLRQRRALYVQCSLESMPFKYGVFDAVVAYGVLHHLPQYEENAKLLVKLLAADGLFIGADPLKRPDPVRWARRLLQKRTTGASAEVRTGMSPHNDFIDWKNLQEVIKPHARVLKSFEEYSPLRGVLVKILMDEMGFRNKNLVTFLIALDNAWLKTIGKLSPILGPAAVHYAILNDATYTEQSSTSVDCAAVSTDCQVR